MRNQVQLIAYVDRLGGTLPGVRSLLEGPLSGLFGGVHLLPFYYPIDGADAGFDPIDHTAVDARLGTWDDIAAIAATTDVMADVIVNHISSASPQFRDFTENGGRSDCAGMFLTLERVFPNGASEGELAAIYRPRPGLPFTTATLADGTQHELWTTFAPEQIDIDVTDSRGIAYLESILRILSESGVSMIRLDAVGYAVKKPGTSCFMIPETFEFIDAFAKRAGEHGLEVLVEVHSHYKKQIAIAAHVSWVYDFALPPLVLHAIFHGTSRYLRQWIDIRPANCVTVLDTHDGIGVIDVGDDDIGAAQNPGLMPAEEIDRLVEQIHRNSNGESLRATGAAASNLDLYQVNCTFYDALGRDDRKLLLSRAIQFFLPGIPQVYYVGLLAGTNDMELLARTGVGRDINRRYFDSSALEAALARPVVKKLIELIRLRSGHPAFAGNFELNPSSDKQLDLTWRQGGEFARLRIDFGDLSSRLEYSTHGRTERFEFPMD